MWDVLCRACSCLNKPLQRHLVQICNHLGFSPVTQISIFNYLFQIWFEELSILVIHKTFIFVNSWIFSVCSPWRNWHSFQQLLASNLNAKHLIHLKDFSVIEMRCRFLPLLRLLRLLRYFWKTMILPAVLPHCCLDHLCKHLDSFLFSMHRLLASLATKLN